MTVSHILKKVFHILLAGDDYVSIIDTQGIFEKNDIRNTLNLDKNEEEAPGILCGKDRLELVPSSIQLDVYKSTMNGMGFLRMLLRYNELKYLQLFIFSSTVNFKPK